MTGARYDSLSPAVKRPVLWADADAFDAESEADRRAAQRPFIPIRVLAEAFMRGLWEGGQRHRPAGLRLVRGEAGVLRPHDARGETKLGPRYRLLRERKAS